MDRVNDTAIKQIEEWLTETSHRTLFNSTDVADRLLDILLALDQKEKASDGEPARSAA